MYWNVLWEFFIKYFEDTSFNVRGSFLLWGGGGGGGVLYQKIRLSSVGLAGCAVTVVGWAERLSRCLYPVSSRAF